MSRQTRFLMLMIVCTALLVTSCKRLRGPEPTVRPTITPTPRSTPLPPLATLVPLGSTGNPLHMMLVIEPDRQQLLDTVVTELEDGILEATKLTIDVELVDNDAEALAALCASPDGEVTGAWLSGLAYAAAYAQNCGNASIQVERGQRSQATTGDQALIITPSGLDVGSVGDLAEHNFCRLGYDDVYSWLIPSLMLRGSGVTSGDLDEIRDYTDASQMIDDVASGDCDAAGISASQFAKADQDTRSKIRTLQQSVEIPYSVLVVPPQLPLAQQQQLSDALVALANGSRGASLKPLLEQDQLVAVADSDLSSLRSFITRAGIDLAQAGT